MGNDAYAGVRRRKQTPWHVKFSDALVTKLITVGGIATIGAVLLVVLVLLATAWPLYRSPTYENWRHFSLGDATAKSSLESSSKSPTKEPSPAGSSADSSTSTGPSSAVLTAGCDEFGAMLWLLSGDGSLRVVSSLDGKTILTVPSPAGEARRVTSHALSVDRQTVALGFSDGSFQLATFKFQSSLLKPEQVPESVKLTADQPTQLHEQAIYQLFGESSVRRIEVVVPSWTKPEKIADDAIVAIDYIPADTSNQFALATSSTLAAMTSQSIVLAEIVTTENMQGELKQELKQQTIKAERRSTQPPLAIMLANRASQLMVVWGTGTLDRYAIANGQPQFKESASGLPPGGEFSAACVLIARQTMLLGDKAGKLHGWSIVQTDNATADDGYRLAATHFVSVSDKPITSITSSSASHLALIHDDDHKLSLVMATTDTLLKQVNTQKQLPDVAGVRLAFLKPKNDGVFLLGESQAAMANLDVAFPEANLRALFGKVWYEGHAEPKYIWQSSAGTEQAEPKLSLIPLIFGTLKATVYAMAFSIPLALFAAIYTSEFLAPRVRSRVKPIIELMASLPSVILGFIAALVLAPLLQNHLCAVLLSFFVLPATFIYAAHLWNLLPLEFLVRAQTWRLWFLLACIPIGVTIAMAMAPIVEHWLFSGDIVQWMSGNVGQATGGWMLLLIPAIVCLAAFLMLGPLASTNRARAIQMTPGSFALRGLLQLVSVTVGVLVCAYGLSLLMNATGLDPRASFFTGYQERNSLLVGAVLGFCIIPLIYTLADDALQSVPQQLRSASLGCGATPWQTTVRVVVPSAMSGMFSAIMIGFGRAVGETMVVLMAAGNTPIMEWNPFNGFRTLSATLATELPEAAKGSTHFRTLFLAALLLFTLTLVANTAAEYVRIRVRRRGSQL